MLTRDAARAKKVACEKQADGSEGDELMKDNQKTERKCFDNENNNVDNDMGMSGPNGSRTKTEMTEQEIEDLVEANRLLKKQLESRDAIIKKQISEMHRLQSENKNLSQDKMEMEKDRDNARKECEAERWLGERLKYDIRDLEMQLDFQDCYLQEQTHHSKLMENFLNELQKRSEAQEKEITQLRQQLNAGKEKVDNQIKDLQRLLGINKKIQN